MSVDAALTYQTWRLDLATPRPSQLCLVSGVEKTMQDVIDLSCFAQTPQFSSETVVISVLLFVASWAALQGSLSLFEPSTEPNSIRPHNQSWAAPSDTSIDLLRAGLNFLRPSPLFCLQTFLNISLSLTPDFELPPLPQLSRIQKTPLLPDPNQSEQPAPRLNDLFAKAERCPAQCFTENTAPQSLDTPEYTRFPSSSNHVREQGCCRRHRFFN